MSIQTSLSDPTDRLDEALAHAARREYDTVIGLSSGGTDSLTAIKAYHERHGRHDLPPIDAVVQTNTGTTLPSTLETAREFCAENGLRYLEIRNQFDPADTGGDAEHRMLGPRIVRNGFPADSQGGPGSGGHWMEFINRKLDTWDRLYSAFPGELLWISGARTAESDRRAMNLGDGAVDFGEQGDKQPRKTWIAPIHGWLDGEKAAFIDKHDIPVAPAYDWLGYSGDCIACSFDDPTVLNEVRILCPELAWALETLVVWVYLRIRAGEIDQPIERCVWGTEIITDEETHQCEQRSLRFGGCSEPGCRASRGNEVSER